MTLILSDLDLSTIPDKLPAESEIASVIVIRFPYVPEGHEGADTQLAEAAGRYFADVAEILGTTVDRISGVSRNTIVDTEVSYAAFSGADLPAPA